MRIPTNETVLRENLHDAVDNLSLVNIIILLVLIRAVHVINFLRPTERDIKSLPEPRPELPEHDGMDLVEQGTGPELPQPIFRDPRYLAEFVRGTETFEEMASRMAQDGEQDELRVNGQTFSEYFGAERLAQERETERLGREMVAEMNGPSPFNERFPSRPIYRSELPNLVAHSLIAGWAVTDCNERICLIQRPMGEFRIDRYTNDIEIDAPQYTQEQLEGLCNWMNGNLERGQRAIRSHCHSFDAYCTPSRSGAYTGRIRVGGFPHEPEPLFYGSPRSRHIAEAYENRTNQAHPPLTQSNGE